MSGFELQNLQEGLNCGQEEVDSTYVTNFNCL